MDIVERKHQHILNVNRTLLFQANISSLFWEFFVNHIVFLINSTLTPPLSNLSSYKKNFMTNHVISPFSKNLAAFDSF